MAKLITKKAIDTLFSDHIKLAELLKEIDNMFLPLNMNPQTPNERYTLLQGMILIVYRIEGFLNLHTAHFNFENEYIYPGLEEAGFKREVKVLYEQHGVIRGYVREIKNLLEQYREKTKPIEEISRNIREVFEKIKSIIFKHWELEEKLLRRYWRKYGSRIISQG